MPDSRSVLAAADDLPIRTTRPVHSGKVRSVYWLDSADSRRLIRERDYQLPEGTPLAVMVISDRISAFDCIWHGEEGLRGVPGKGAALNAIASHWFARFREAGLAYNHIVEIPHPLVWIVQQARPIKIEAIARAYITGSMWRAYAAGEREFCGAHLPEGLEQNQRLPELLITPSTKGVLEGIPGIPEADDTNISRTDIEANFQAFGFRSIEDIALYETLLRRGFELISRHLAALDQIFVDTKFEFGYVRNTEGHEELIYMDEVGTPDSSRIWDGPAWREGRILEKSKESFRQFLLSHFKDPDILLNKQRMDERIALARDNALPREALEKLSETYRDIAGRITGREVPIPGHARDGIIDSLADYGLIEKRA